MLDTKSYTNIHKLNSMLIKNISDKNIQIPTSVGEGKTFTLEPGKIAYIEDKRSKDNQIIIWSRKKIIELKEVNKPEKLQYDTPYSTTKQLNIAPPTVATIVDEDDEDDEIITELPAVNIDEVTESGDEEEPEYGDSDGDVSEDTAEDAANPAPAKNKGGRPKGVKNKKKKKGKKKTPTIKNKPNSSDSGIE